MSGGSVGKVALLVFSVVFVGIVVASGTFGLSFDSGIATVAGQSDTVADEEWAAVRHDSALTGANPAAAGPTGDVGPGWIVRTGTTRGGPVVRDGVVYTGNRQGELYALDAETGEQRWQTPVEGEIWQSPAVTDERVVVLSAEGFEETTIWAVDRETGAIEWEYETDLVVSEHESPVVADDGTVVVAGWVDGERAVVGLDPTPDAGEWPETWRITYADGAGIPVVTDDTVYAIGGVQQTDDDPMTLYAFDRETGDTRWEQSIDGWTRHLLLADGTLYTHTSDRLYAIDPETGDIRAEHDVEIHYDTPLAYADGTLYYPTGAGWEEPAGLAAFDTDSGEVVWTEWSVEDPRSPPSVGGEHVYISDSDAIYAVDRDSGTLAWEYRPQDPYSGTDNELVVVDETLYVSHLRRTTRALVEGGDASEGGFVDAVRWLRDNAELGMMGFGAIGGFLGGLVAAGLTWGLIRARGYSRLPPRIFAGKLLRRPVSEVSNRATVLAHVVAGVVLSTVFGGLFLGMQLGLPRLASPFVGVAVPLLFALLFIGPVLFAILAIGGPWAVIAYRWLPAVPEALDREVGRARREWAIVHVVFAVIAVPIYGFVTFLLGMLVFFV